MSLRCNRASNSNCLSQEPITRLLVIGLPVDLYEELTRLFSYGGSCVVNSLRFEVELFQIILPPSGLFLK